MPPSEHELRLRERLSRLRAMPLLGGAKLSGELERLQRQLDRIEAEPTDAEIWRSVELARHPDRPYTLDYVARLLDDWFELHGDRSRADDGAMVTGLGKLDGRTVALVGQQKGRDIHERTKRQFGMPYPEGYRKAIRVLELADLHGFPVISLVDTPGAYPGVSAEQHGQGGAIAFSQAAMARVRVPTVTCVIGEGSPIFAGMGLCALRCESLCVANWMSDCTIEVPLKRVAAVGAVISCRMPGMLLAS